MTWLLWLFLWRQTSGCQKKVRIIKWFFNRHAICNLCHPVGQFSFYEQLYMNFSNEGSKATKDKVSLSSECTGWICICFSLLVSIEQCQMLIFQQVASQYLIFLMKFRFSQSGGKVSCNACTFTTGQEDGKYHYCTC